MHSMQFFQKVYHNYTIIDWVKSAGSWQSTPRCAAVRALRNLWYQQINLDGPHNHQFILSTNDASSTSRLFIWIFVIISLLTSATMFTILHICHVWSNLTLARYSLLFIRILYSHFPSPAYSLKTGTVSHLRRQTRSQEILKGRMIEREGEYMTSRVSSPFCRVFFSIKDPDRILLNGRWQLQGPARQNGATEYEHPAILMRSCFP